MLANIARKVAKIATLVTRPGTEGEGEAATATLWHVARGAVLAHGWQGAEVVWDSTEALPPKVRARLWDRVCDLYGMMDRIDSLMASGEVSDEGEIGATLWGDLTYTG